MLTEPPQEPHKITSVLTLVTFPVNVTKTHNQKQLHEGAVYLGFQLESTQFVMAGKSGGRDIMQVVSASAGRRQSKGNADVWLAFSFYSV